MTVKNDYGIKPEIVAAICAAVNIILEQEEKMRSAVPVLRLKKPSPAWVVAGRQKVMDSRLESSR